MIDRKLAKGIGEALAHRTFFRTKPNGKTENWQDVARRVSRGNLSILGPVLGEDEFITADVMNPLALQLHEADRLGKHISNASALMSGRHLQQGDEQQKNRPINIFANCATAATSFALLYLLLAGSGVGRCYDDDVMIVNWKNLPIVKCILSADHPDFESDLMVPVYPNDKLIRVPDSREGWAKIVEELETAAHEGTHRNEFWVIDFSNVRCKGSPIGGMQDRPASGPIPLIRAIQSICAIRDGWLSNRPIWLQTMFVDHYLADCVVVGGARRSSRIAIRHWRHTDIQDFITLKKDFPELYSSNNSVGLDQEYYDFLARTKRAQEQNLVGCSRDQLLAQIVFRDLSAHSYDTGEPGVLNVHKLARNDDGIEEYLKGNCIGSSQYKLSVSADEIYAQLTRIVAKKSYNMIVNPCGEIALFILGGYCVIGDAVLYFCETYAEMKEVVRLITRALIRTNLLDAFYHYETKRTNRIGVSLTGIHEFALKHFGYSFYDLIDEAKSQPFWDIIGKLKRAVEDEAERYSKELGVTVPHTNTTIKPAGSTSKLFGLSEGAHLPPRLEYLRWMQYLDSDPLVAKMRLLGYPVKALKKYNQAVIVGFPTVPEICAIDRKKVVIAEQATPEQHYKWVLLLEKYWIDGVKEDGTPLATNTGNQVSYTLKIDPKKVSLEAYREMLIKYQSQVKACSVMPALDEDVMEELYEYLPEQKVSYEEFMGYVLNITDEDFVQGFDFSTLQCGSGGCPEI